MKNSIITEAQIVKAIKEYEGGRELNDVCRELGVHKSTFITGVKSMPAWSPNFVSHNK